jgi:hypothetical protein
MLVLHGVFYGCALIGFLQRSEGQKVRLLEACRVFLTVNVAYLVGWFKYLRGETYTTWKPHRQPK